MAMTPLSVKDGTNTSKSLVACLDRSGYIIPIHCLDATRPTYAASAVFTPQPTAAVVLVRVQGSATKTVRITRVSLEGVSTANANVPIALQRESTAGAGGTAVISTPAKLDLQDAAATAVVKHFTTSLVAAGTAVGDPLWSGYMTTNVVTTPTISAPRMPIWPPIGTENQSIVLRGTGDYLVIKNTNAGNLSAGTVLAYTIQWVEDDS